MPIIYPTRERRRIKAVDLEKLKNKLVSLGFVFTRDGGFRPEDKPFKYSNYLFYDKKDTNEHYRIGYDYPLFGSKNSIFEICYWKSGYGWGWHDLIPDYRKQFWKDVISDNIPYCCEWRDKYRKKNK